MISVAISTYNGERYIIEQLNSIYEQDILPDEVVIVDDSSNDSTFQIICNWVSDKSNINWRVFKNDVNQGYIKTFFRAINLTMGDIIILCDQDDIWARNKVREILSVFENTKVLSYHSEIDIIDNNGDVLKKSVLGYKGYNVFYSPFEFLHRLNYCGMSSAFRSSIKNDLQDIQPETIPTHDWVIHALASVKNGLYVSNKVTTYRRFHGDNVALKMDRTKRAKINQRIDVVGNYKKYYELYLSLLYKFGNNDSSTIKIALKYFQVSQIRLNYLINRDFITFFKNILNTRYYSSIKAYFCDFMYMIGFF